MATGEGAEKISVKGAPLQTFLDGFGNVIKHIEPAKQEINQLKTKMAMKDEENARKIKQLENEVEVVNRNNDELANDKEGMRKEILQLKKDIANSQSDLELAKGAFERERQSIHIQMNKTVAELTSRVKELEEKLIEKEMQIVEVKRTTTNEHLQEVLSKNTEQLSSELRRQLDDKMRDLKDKDGELDGLMTKIKGLERENKQLQKDNDANKARLGGLLSKNLQTSNPSITNLAEENRPTKVAELYSELYNNQWTDAYEESEKLFSDKPESDHIKMLGRVFMSTNQFCRKEAVQQKDELFLTLTRSKEKENIEVPASTQKSLNECRRELARLALDPLYQKFIAKQVVKIKCELKKLIEATPAYVKECIRVSWLMSLQDPPVAICDFTPNTPFESQNYREYSCRGDMMEFLAWPALQLHENGPVLVKGVAQCYKSTERKNHKPTVSTDRNKNNTGNMDVTKEESVDKLAAQCTHFEKPTGDPNSGCEVPYDTPYPEEMAENREKKTADQDINDALPKEELLLSNPILDHTDKNEGTLHDTHIHTDDQKKTNHESSRDISLNQDESAKVKVDQSHLTKGTVGGSAINQEISRKTGNTVNECVHENPNNVGPSENGENMNNVKDVDQDMAFANTSSNAAGEERLEYRNDLDAGHCQQRREEQNTTNATIEQGPGGAYFGHITESHSKCVKGANKNDIDMYPPDLIPTEKELKNFKWHVLHYSKSVAKHQLGHSLYDKCKRYLQWKEKIDK